MSEMLALTLGARLVQVVWALPGAIVPWLGFGRPPGHTADEAFKDAETPREKADVGVFGGAA